MSPPGTAHRVTPVVLILGALAATYVLWGASFLAIRVLVVEQPPWSLAGARFVLAGALLALWARARGAAWLGGGELRHAALVSLFLFVGTYGGVFWAAQFLPSGFVALLMASIPVFVALVEAVRRGGSRSGPVVWLGLVVGLVGVSVLVDSGAALSAFGGRVAVLPVVVGLASALSWAVGTGVVLSGARAGHGAMHTATQMGIGGAVLLAVGVLSGERVDGRAFMHVVPLASFLYLILGASIVAFLAYRWLLDHVSPTLASSYAYVNPLFAVGLGMAVLGEPFTPGMGWGGALVVAAVLIVARGGGRRAGVAGRAAAGAPDAPEGVGTNATTAPVGVPSMTHATALNQKVK